MSKSQAVTEVVATPTQKRQAGSRGLASFYRSVLFTGGGTAVAIVTLFLETMVAVRWLDRESYGAYVLFITIANLLVLVVDLGSKTAMPQLMAKHSLDEQAVLVGNTLLLRFLTLGGLTAIIWVFGRPLLSMLGLENLTWGLVYFPMLLALISIDELFFGILQGYQAYKQLAIAQVVRSLLRLALSLLFLVGFTWGVISLIYSWLAAFLVAICYQWWAMPIKPQWQTSPRQLQALLRFGFPIYLTRFLGIVNGQVDKLILGALAGPGSVALYDVASKIPMALQRLFQSYTAVYYPTVATLVADDRHHEAESMLNHALRLSSTVLATLALGAVLFGREITTLFFSDRYADSGLVFGLLVLAMHMQLLVNLMGFTLTAAGHPQRTLGENSVRIVVGVVLNLLLIPGLRHIAPAVATLAANYAANPVALWLLHRSGLTVEIVQLLKQLGLLLLCCSATWIFAPLGFLPRIALLFFFIAANFALAIITPDDWRILLPHSVFSQLSHVVARVKLTPKRVFVAK